MFFIFNTTVFCRQLLQLHTFFKHFNNDYLCTDYWRTFICSSCQYFFLFFLIFKVFYYTSVIVIYCNTYVQSKNISGKRQLFVASSPTNPTPPDSLTSDDSSYMSARDSSATSLSTARVRFSPVTLLDLPTQGQHQDSTVPLQASSPSSRRSSSISEFIA